MNEYEKKRTELMNKAEAAVAEHRFEDFAAIKAEIEKLDEDEQQANVARANLKAMSEAPAAIPGIMNGGSVDLSGKSTGIDRETQDMYATDEYRRGFMNALLRGEKLPEMKNADAQTVTGDVGAVIPTTIVKRIYEKMESVGKIWSRITHTSFQGGVSVPTSSLKPTATWVSERGTADTQKKPVESIVFTYNKLICKVALSFEVSVVTLDVFEATLADNIAEAMVKAVEKAVISGTGTGQPKGVLKETVPTKRNIVVSASPLTYKNLAAAEGALPSAYESGSVWVMTKATFMNEIIGLTDSNGNPVMRELIGVNGKPAYYIFGREVVLVDGDYMDTYSESATADMIFAFIFDWKYYIGNTNYSVTMREYIDEDTDDRVKKALMLFDGKAVDTNGLVLMTKKKNTV